MADGQIVFEITADGKRAIASVKDVTAAIQRESKAWDASAQQGANGIESAFMGAAKKIAAGFSAAAIGKALFDFGRAAVGVASSLEEVQNVVDTTFGESAAEINSWAKNAQTQFGLTELQAKQFSSTIGAMMKSAGMSSDEIVGMSKDLAGLAADMASFYNMDFETAFQKIRSGISGETEPLKQLGINMSVANLEAFAMTQGITKAFNKMSQGEQTMLRYQYLMQATADAQGDFARTSDSLANSQRRLETAFESIKASVGQILLPAVADATSGIAGLLEKLTAPHEKTVLEEFEDINLDTATKIAEIQKTAEEAGLLISVLQELGKPIENTSLTSFVEAFSGKISDLGGAVEAAKSGDYTGTITALADALSKEVGGDPDKWANMLTAIGDNAGAALAAVSGGPGETQAFLEAVAAGADDLTTDYSSYWENLLSVLGDNAGDAIAALANGNTAGNVMTAIAQGANLLNSNSTSLWTSLLRTLKQVDGLSNVFNNTKAGKNVEDLAKALSGHSPDVSKAEAWKTFLGALQENAGALTALTQTDAGETAAWLQTMADAANSLTPDNAEGWDKLLSNFVTGLPGLKDTEAGKGFFNSLKQEFLAMGNESDAARAGLAALGMSTDEIDREQKAWLETCRRLVDTIPGLASVINTETGAVEGGIDAIGDYVTEWQRAQEKIIAWKAFYAKKDALLNAENGIGAAIVDEKYAKAMVDQTKKAFEEGYAKYAKQAYGKMTDNPQFDWSQVSDLQAVPNAITNLRRYNSDAYNNALTLWNEYAAAVKAADEASQHLIDTQEANKAAIEATANVEQQMIDQYGPLEEGATDAAEAMTLMEKAASGDEQAMSELQTTLQAAADAMQDLDMYVQAAYEDTARTVGNVINGFEEVITPAQQKTKDLTETLTKLTEAQNALDTSTDDGSKQWEEYKKQIDNVNTALNELNGGSTVTALGMRNALQSQLDYIKDYREAMDKAREKGVSEEILASLSDGTMDSYNYLRALGNAGADDITAINQMYADVQKESAEFTNTLTEQKLKVDETFQGLVTAAQDALNQLNMGDAAKASVEATVQGIVDGLQSKSEAVSAQVDAIIASVSRLSNLGGFGFGGGLFSWFFNSGNSGGGTDGSFATGLDYVPFDHFLAELHEGEGILTAEENRIWQNFKTGQTSTRNSFDYGAMSGAIWDNAPSMGGGNVYLDGQTVGRVISARQADSFRTLERSGWQR